MGEPCGERTSSRLPNPHGSSSAAVIDMAPQRRDRRVAATDGNDRPSTCAVRMVACSRLERRPRRTCMQRCSRCSVGGETIDRHFTRFGWRQFEICGRDVLAQRQADSTLRRPAPSVRPVRDVAPVRLGVVPDDPGLRRQRGPPARPAVIRAPTSSSPTRWASWCSTRRPSSAVPSR